MTKNNNNQEINFPEKPVVTFKEGKPFFIDLDGKTTVQLDENGRVEQVGLPNGEVIKFSIDQYGIVWNIDFPRGGKISTYLEKTESAKKAS